MKLFCKTRGCKNKFKKSGRRLYCSNACKQRHYRNKNRYDKTRVLTSSEADEWYTPKTYIDASCKVLGTINLDPASCLKANTIVQADTYYTKEEDGLNRPWFGTVFCNPPYGKNHNTSNQSLFLNKAISEYKNNNIKACILLLNASVSNQWFQKVWDYVVCITKRRIRFSNPAGEFNSPTNGNVFVYMGQEEHKFIEVFAHYGKVITP